MIMGSSKKLFNDAFNPGTQLAAHQHLGDEVGSGVDDALLVEILLQMVLVVGQMEQLVNDEIERRLVMHVHDGLVQVNG